MQIGSLGPVDLIDDDGASVELLSRRQRRVLVVLAMRRDRVVPVDVISTAKWLTRLVHDRESPVGLHWPRPDGGLTGSPGMVAGCRPTTASSQP